MGSLGLVVSLKIHTNERPCRCYQAKTPRHTVALPTPTVLEIREDEAGTALRRKVDQRDQEDEEEAYVEEKRRGFDMWEDCSSKDVHKDGNQEYRPVDQCSMPTQWFVVPSVQNDQSLDQLASNESRARAYRQTCKDRYPT